jgi:TolB protein
LRGEFLVNYKRSDDVRAAVAELNHDAWELTDDTGRKWWIIKVCGNLASLLPQEAPIATPVPRPLLPLAEVIADGLVVRSCAAEECAEVGAVQRGVQLEVFGCLATGGDWCEVGWSEGRGWCTGKSLRQLAVAEAVPVVKALVPTAEVIAAGPDKIVFSCFMWDAKLNEDGTFVTHPTTGAKYYDTRDEICVINPDGSGLTRLTYHNDNSNAGFETAWSPDRKQIAFVRGGDYFVMNADGSSLTHVYKLPDSGGYPTYDVAWTPGGQQIAFSRGNGIYIMNVDGSGLTRLADGHYPAWSPDGKRIAFFGQGGLYVMNTDGGDQTLLSDRSGNSPDWSPDGSQIVFTSVRDRSSEIYVINTDGSGLISLTNTPESEEFEPAWSPDGQKIVFTRDGTDLYIMNADGSGVMRLTEQLDTNGGLTGLAGADYPDW